MPARSTIDAIDAYLTYQYVPAPQAAFQAARKLPPGSFVWYEDGQIRSSATGASAMTAVTLRPTRPRSTRSSASRSAVRYDGG